MSQPNLLPGYRFRLLRGDGGAPENFAFVCTATTQKLDEKLEFDDSMLLDCDDPNSLPERVSVPKGITWDITFSGKCDARRYQILRGDLLSANPRNWQLFVDQPSSNGGGIFQGLAFLETLTMSKSENGLTTFDSSLKGQGKLIWTPAAQ
jgi:hypothetical protein